MQTPYGASKNKNVKNRAISSVYVKVVADYN